MMTIHHQPLASSRTAIGLAIGPWLFLIGMLATTRAGSATEFEFSISGLRELDQTFETIKSQGAASWASDRIKSSVREQFPVFFGDDAERVLTAGEHTYSIQSRGFTAIERMTSATSAEEVQQHSDEFWGWIRGDELPSLGKDVLPRPVRTVVEGAERLRDDAAWLVEKGEGALESASSVKERIASYFSDSSEYGLEPESADAKAVVAGLGVEGVAFGPQPEQLAAAERWEQEYELGSVSDVEYPSESESQPFSFEANDDARAAIEEAAQPTLPPRRGEFDDELAMLEEELGLSGQSGAADDFQSDIEMLASELGLAPGEPTELGDIDWAAEATQMEAATAAWEHRQAEQQRLAALAVERQRLAAREAEAQQARRRQQQQHDAEYAAAQRRALAHSSSSDSSGRGWGSFLRGALEVGAAVYVAKELSEPRQSSNQPTMPSSNQPAQSSAWDQPPPRPTPATPTPDPVVGECGPGPNLIYCHK